MTRIETIDAHTAGEPLRLIVSGFPTVEGATILEQREFVRQNVDHLRRALMLEPRGHADMYGALLTEPVSPGSHAGVLFMHNEGYSTMCGHGVIAVTTIAIERGLIFGPDFRADATGSALVLDTPAGTVHARPRVVGAPGQPRVDSVTFVNVPSFVYSAGHPVKVGTRELRVDIAFGGAFYAIVDTEAIGIPLEVHRLPELRRIATDIK